MRFHHDDASHTGINSKEARHPRKTKNAEKDYEIREIVICQSIHNNVGFDVTF